MSHWRRGAGRYNVRTAESREAKSSFRAMSSTSTQSEIGARSLRGVGRGWLRVALGFVAAVLLQIAVMDFHAWTYDESLSLYGAVRVLHGQVPFRDFWTLYPPGIFWTLAAMFRVFGVSVLCDRAVFIGSNAISAVAMVSILDRLTGRWWLSRMAAGAGVLWVS